MKKIFVLFLLFFSIVFAKDDYSEMSTEELIAIIGYVKAKDKVKFKKELKSRIPTMSTKEKEEFEKNRQKLEKK